MSKKTRRRGSRRRKNPMSRRGGIRRAARRARNPRRRRSSYRRNPPQIVKDLFGVDTLSSVAGILIGSAGSQTVLNFLQGADATGQRRFSLPGVDYTAAATPALFYQKNAAILALYKLAIGGGAGYLLRNQSPRLARGIMLGGVVGAASDLLTMTGILSGGAIQLARMGVGRNFPARAGMGLMPGTSTRFTGPAQQFLATGNNVPRPGMAARVGPNMVANTEGMVEGAFRGAN